jgi:hypothetical protein
MVPEELNVYLINPELTTIEGDPVTVANGYVSGY